MRSRTNADAAQTVPRLVMTFPLSARAGGRGIVGRPQGQSRTVLAVESLLSNRHLQLINPPVNKVRLAIVVVLAIVPSPLLIKYGLQQ